MDPLMLPQFFSFLPSFTYYLSQTSDNSVFNWSPNIIIAYILSPVLLYKLHGLIQSDLKFQINSKLLAFLNKKGFNGMFHLYFDIFVNLKNARNEETLKLKHDFHLTQKTGWHLIKNNLINSSFRFDTIEGKYWWVWCYFIVRKFDRIVWANVVLRTVTCGQSSVRTLWQTVWNGSGRPIFFRSGSGIGMNFSGSGWQKNSGGPTSSRFC